MAAWSLVLPRVENLLEYVTTLSRGISMYSISQELDQALGRLDPETASLLEKTVRDAVALATTKLTAPETDAIGYPVGFFESTAGSFANEPLERPANLPLEIREPW